MTAERLYLDPRKMRCARLRRTVRAAARQLEWEASMAAAALGRRGFRKTFITLTYRKVGEWEPHHISRFVRLMRQWFHRQCGMLDGEAFRELCRFVWVAELQKRGALHYHVLVFVPRHLRLPRPDVCGWWPHGASKIETARNPVGYMVKYATKTGPDDLARLPKGVRLHGNGGMGDFARRTMRIALWPQWLRERNNADCFLRFYTPGVAEDLGVAPGWSDVRKVTGGWLDRSTGELQPTPWRVIFEPGGQVAIERKPEERACIPTC